MADYFSGTMLARLGPGVTMMASLFKRMRQAWDSPQNYRPGDHYMRGPGPKWREKHGQNRPGAGLVQHPMQLGDKWDF